MQPLLESLAIILYLIIELKDEGQPQVDRLRDILLFEVDYNFTLKLIWANVSWNVLQNSIYCIKPNILVQET